MAPCLVNTSVVFGRKKLYVPFKGEKKGRKEKVLRLLKAAGKHFERCSTFFVFLKKKEKLS